MIISYTSDSVVCSCTSWHTWHCDNFIYIMHNVLFYIQFKLLPNDVSHQLVINANIQINHSRESIQEYEKNIRLTCY